MKPTVKLPPYPKDIENWWWIQVRQKWSELSEDKIINLIRKEIVAQSDRFNKSRLFLPQSYGSRDLSILAYGNFFFAHLESNVFCLRRSICIQKLASTSKGPN